MCLTVLKGCLILLALTFPRAQVRVPAPRPPRRRSWQTLPPPGASAIAPGQYNYAPIHEQALAIQEMGYTAYDRLNKQVGGAASWSDSC